MGFRRTCLFNCLIFSFGVIGQALGIILGCFGVLEFFLFFFSPDYHVYDYALMMMRTTVYSTLL